MAALRAISRLGEEGLVHLVVGFLLLQQEEVVLGLGLVAGLGRLQHAERGDGEG